MKTNCLKKLVSLVLVGLMIFSILPTSVFAAIANWEETNVVFSGTSFGTNGYYNVISKKDYVLVPGAAVESEMVLNNAEGTRRQVLHIIEVDPSNPDVSIVPGYNQIDKDLTDEANWSHKELTEMAKYYEKNLGYNIVGGMNTDLYYDTYAPRILVYNGKDLSVKGQTTPSSSILYVFKDAEGNISCDVKAFNRTDFDSYLADGTLLHAVSVSFGMVVKDGELVTKTEERTSSAAARSMVGVKEDGTLVICMNDGRSANNSVGFCTYEEGEAMLALGCQWAANCDGGGSSTFLTKRVGEETFTMRSVPCDGAQRPTAHGIFVASNVAPTGVLDVVNIDSEYDIFAPNTQYQFSAEAIDTHGYAMDMPADATWALSDSSFGTIEDGYFISNGTKGSVDVQVLSGGVVVGSKTITVADPETFALSATSTVVPYSTADKVRTITLPIVAMTGESNVYVDTNAVSVSLSDTNAGVLDGFKFTATDDTSIAGVDVTVTYGDTALVYAIEFGKGSEVIYDFEDGDKAGFMGFEEAKKWSQDNGVNNTLVGSSPLAGQFNEYLSSNTFISTTTNGGQVRNGENALAWRLDNTDADFANWSYNVLFNVGETIVLRDVENGLKATTLGMWIYIPEDAFPADGGKGLAFQSQLYIKNADGSYTCKQDHFMFTSAATGNKTNLNSATNADIPESRWVYASIDISKYDYLCTPIATDVSNTRAPSIIRTYVKPTIANEITFYIDDITLDYSSAVDDRVLPTITAPTYSTADTAVSLEDGTTVNGNKLAFSATVADNSALDLTSGKISVDGVEVKATVAGNALSSTEDVTLVAGTHTVAFEIKDELGNPAKITRTFTVEGDAVVELSGHNDSGEAAMAQSVYYVDVNVADTSNVTKLVANLKLQNANTWETEGAVVADGFNATFSYNEVSELLTVTVEATDSSKVKALEQTLVSIPVRVWTFDRYNYVTNTYIDSSSMGNKPVVNIECEVAYGEITLADKTVSPFGGAIDVATELISISSPYHTHDEELTVLNKDATCTTDGYTDRTYCETCASVVDWGTTVSATGHTYEVVDGKIVCDCGETVTETGLFTINGNNYYAIAGNLITGWQLVDDEYYYFDKTTYAGLNGTYSSFEVCQTSHKFEYTFTNGKLDSGVWVETANGTRYYYGNSYYAQKFATIDGKVYGFDSNGYKYVGTCVIKWNPHSDWQLHEFTEDGVFVGEIHDVSGIYMTTNGNVYYLTDGVASRPGLVESDGYYYYFDSASIYAKANCSYYVSNTNGLLPAATYDFDAEGRIIIKQGLVTGSDGKIRYYVNDVATYAGLVQDENGDYYYISGSTMAAVTDCTYNVSKTNDLLPAGTYAFGADGKMKQGIVEDSDGEIRYYVNGKSTYAGLVQDENGDYYYFSGSTMTAVRDGSYNVSKTNDLLPTGRYAFGADGKMKQGIVEDSDGEIRYYVNGKSTYAGLVQDENGDYYYFSGSTMTAVRDGSYNVSKTNDLLPTGRYAFGADGKMKQGIVTDSDGEIRYYVNGKSTYAGLVQDTDGSFYYFSGSTLKAVKDGTYNVSKSNGLLPTGKYNFDADGKMIIKHGVVIDDDGEIRYYVNNKVTYAGLVKDYQGNYYYISGSTLTAIKNTTRYITFTNDLLPAGTYTFGADGKMVTE